MKKQLKRKALDIYKDPVQKCANKFTTKQLSVFN